ncbi:MAG: cytochrome c oxidase subunit II [Chloroflexota bacterium]
METLDTITREGSAISGLFILELAISFVLLALVVTWLVVALVRFRARPDDATEPPQIHGNTRIELVWTITPAVILAVVLVLVIGTMRSVAANDRPGMPLRIVGHQFWWEYEFPDQQAITANELHVPVGRTVTVMLESADVIHDFHVPQFGWMRDAIPGKTNRMSFYFERPGRFDGTCNQYCGLQHAWMRVVAQASPASEFDAWVQQQSAPAAPTGSRGEAVFLQNTCVSCHSIRGLANGPRVGPDLTHLGSRTTLGTGVVENTAQRLHDWIRNPNSIKPGVLMPPYPSLSEGDLAELVNYLESLK